MQESEIIAHTHASRRRFLEEYKGRETQKRLEMLAGRLGADQATPRTSRARFRLDGHQSPVRAGSSRFHEILSRQRGHQEAAEPVDPDCPKHSSRNGAS